MTLVLLARHGETDWNRERRWQGHADVPLNAQGRSQARELAASLTGERVTAVYSSDLSRARETAEIVGAALGLPVRADARLREIDVGPLAGETIRTETRPLDYVAAELGDAFDEMRERVTAALFEIAARHDRDDVLVVTHGGPIAATWVASGGRLADRPVVGNCDVRRIRVGGGRIAGID